MNYLRRIIVSIQRRFSKSILLFFIVFLLGNVIAGAVAIQQSTLAVKKSITSKLGSAVSLQYTEDGASKYTNYSHSTDMGSIIYKYDERVLKVFNQSKEDTRVSYYEYVRSLPYFRGEEIVRLLGVQNTSFTDLELDHILMVEGRTFNDDELLEGRNVIVLDQEYAHRINLHVGDSIVFHTIINEHVQDSSFEVIGLYTRFEESVGNYWREDDHLQNHFYVPYAVLEKEFQQRLELGVSYDEVMGQYWMHSMIFLMDDADDIRDFCKLLEERIKTNALFDVEVQSSGYSYEAVAGPLESLHFIVWIVLALAITISLVIISLVITMCLKDRQHEMGIYLSLGERKWKITVQIMLEIYLIGIFAITLSLFSGHYLGDMVANEVLSAQYEKQREIIELKLEKLNGVNTDVVNVDIILDTFEVQFTREYFVMFYGIGTLVLGISSYVPIRNTLKIKPKDILI